MAVSASLSQHLPGFPLPQRFGIAEIMRQDMWLELRRRSRAMPGTAEMYLDQHRATLSAIERGDSAAASRSVDAHMHTVEERLVAEVESRL